MTSLRYVSCEESPFAECDICGDEGEFYYVLSGVLYTESFESQFCEKCLEEALREATEGGDK